LLRPKNIKKTLKPEPLNRVFGLKTKKEAKAFLDRYVLYVRQERRDLSKKQARQLCLTNIGYTSGYGEPDEARRVLKLFGTTHPIFGKSYPTPQVAFEMGQKLGAKVAREKRK